MKTIKSFLVLILIISPLLSCEDLDEILVQEIDIPLSFVIDINDISVPDDQSPDAENTFLELGNYRISNNPDVDKYIHSEEQIKKIILNSVRYEYRNFSGNVDAIASGEIEFEAETYDTNNGKDVSLAIQPVNVAEASLSTELFNLQGAQGVSIPFDNVDGDINFVFLGTSTANPLIFDARFTVNVTVTVEVNANDLII